MTDKPTRRALLRPVQLIALAVVLAAFAFIVGAVSMGAFTDQPVEVILQAWKVAGILAGVVFIVVLLVVSLLLLAVDPTEFEKPHDRPVLLPDEPDDDTDAKHAGDDTV